MNNVYLAYNLIKPGDRVLDIGGASQPFKRADAVIDIFPYAKRCESNALLRGLREFYTPETWTVQDICDHSKPFPFKDKEFDFVLCGQVLEDIRDPLYVVKEMQRVAKRGLIETPSRFYEQFSGLEFKGLSGASHHRWFVDLKSHPTAHKKELVFTFKNHKVHTFNDYRLTLPFRFRSNRYPYLNPIYDSIAILWDEEFAVSEDVEEAVNGGETFMKETLRQAEMIGDELWDTSQGVVTGLNNSAPIGGVFTLWELKHRWAKRIPIYDKYRQRTPESFAYEEALTGKPLHEEDRKLLLELERQAHLPLVVRAGRKLKRSLS